MRYLRPDGRPIPQRGPSEVEQPTALGLPPLRLVLLDVPAHRSSIGAMGVALGSQMPAEYAEPKPYVYRGTGEDEHPEWDLDYKKPKPLPKPRKAAKPYKRYTPRPEYYARLKKAYEEETRAINEAADLVEQEELQAKRERRRKPVETRRTLLDINDASTWGNRLLPQHPVPLPEVGEDDPPPAPTYRKPPRPAPGWKPMTGTDIEQLLDEIGD